MTKRRSTRISAAVGIIIRQGDRKEPCLTKNVSRTGLAVASRTTWDVSWPIQVSIIEEGFRLNTEARVVHQKDGFLALEFDPNNPDVEPVMNGLVEDLLARTGSSAINADLSDFDNLEGIVKWVAPDQKRSLFKKNFTEGKLGDVTYEGASIETKRPPPTGTDLVIILEYDESNKTLIKVKAKVVRQIDGGFAVSFENPNREARSWVSKLRSYRRNGD